MFEGKDVHKNYLQIALLKIDIEWKGTLNENRKVLDNSRVDNDLSKIDKFFDRLDHNGIVMESSGLWYNIYEYLTKKHIDVRLSNPGQELLHQPR